MTCIYRSQHAAFLARCRNHVVDVLNTRNLANHLSDRELDPTPNQSYLPPRYIIYYLLPRPAALLRYQVRSASLGVFPSGDALD